MSNENVAYITNKKDYISFSYNNKIIRFKGPYSLIRIEKVKEWDNGYIVVDARYSYSEKLIEDYIDLIPILKRLYIDEAGFLNKIEKVEVRNV
ncbi:MAG: hypothetical protein ACI4EI_08855 [Muricoprocola sp.]